MSTSISTTGAYRNNIACDAMYLAERFHSPEVRSDFAAIKEES